MWPFFDKWFSIGLQQSSRISQCSALQLSSPLLSSPWPTVNKRAHLHQRPIHLSPGNNALLLAAPLRLPRLRLTQTGAGFTVPPRLPTATQARASPLCCAASPANQFIGNTWDATLCPGMLMLICIILLLMHFFYRPCYLVR